MRQAMWPNSGSTETANQSRNIPNSSTFKLCPCRPRNKDPKCLTPMPHWKDWFGSLDLVAFNSTMQAHSTTVACTMTKICSLKADFNCASYLHICTSYNKLSRNSTKWILDFFGLIWGNWHHQTFYRYIPYIKLGIDIEIYTYIHIFGLMLDWCWIDICFSSLFNSSKKRR